MSGVIEDIDKRTQLAGNNRLELLMFYLGDDDQLYGINVFKVQEVIVCPPIRSIPGTRKEITGIVDIRGVNMPVIDLTMAIGKSGRQMNDAGYLIVTEYNQRIQGFRVRGVNRIINMNWEDIKPPPKGLGEGCYMTAVASIDDKFVEIIDVEKVMAEMNLIPCGISDDLAKEAASVEFKEKFVLVVDDSVVARKQISGPLKKMGIENVQCTNGHEALEYLEDLAQSDRGKFSRLALVLSDVEMPAMDGYTLVTNIRRSDALRGLKVILHSSLSGGFNEALVEKVGADKFIPKFDADVLTKAIIEMI